MASALTRSPFLPTIRNTQSIFSRWNEETTLTTKRIAVIGNSTYPCGKTCLVKRYVRSQFLGHQDMTLGADFAKKIIEKHKIELEIWDTAGAWGFERMLPMYLANASAVIICFCAHDTESRSFSYESDLKRRLELIHNVTSNAVVALALNQMDLCQEEIKKRFVEVANHYHLPYFFCSAKTGEGVDELFDIVALKAQPVPKEEPSFRISAIAKTKNAVATIPRAIPPPRPNNNQNKKITVIGPGNSGKSSLISRYVEGRFFENREATIGAAFLKKATKNRLELQIWDTGKIEGYASLLPQYLKDASAVIICFSLNEFPPHALDWELELTHKNSDSNAIVILALTKMDLCREYIKKHHIEIASKYCLPYFFCSAKTGEGVDKLFETVAQMLIKNSATQKISPLTKPQVAKLTKLLPQSPTSPQNEEEEKEPYQSIREAPQENEIEEEEKQLELFAGLDEEETESTQTGTTYYAQEELDRRREREEDRQMTNMKFLQHLKRQQHEGVDTVFYYLKGNITELLTKIRSGTLPSKGTTAEQIAKAIADMLPLGLSCGAKIILEAVGYFKNRKHVEQMFKISAELGGYSDSDKFIEDFAVRTLSHYFDKFARYEEKVYAHFGCIIIKELLVQLMVTQEKGSELMGEVLYERAKANIIHNVEKFSILSLSG